MATGRVRTYHTLRRPRPHGGAIVLDYVESVHWRGWYAHEFDWNGRYLSVRRCPSEEILSTLSDEGTEGRELLGP